jgi:glucose/arabinose dehydrogenase
MGDDVPRDELNTAPKKGLHFGFPFCHQGDVSDPELGAARPCSGFPAAGPAARCPRGGNRDALLYRHDVSGRVPQPDHHRGARIVEPLGAAGLPLVAGEAGGNKVVSYTRFAEGWLRGMKPAAAGGAMVGDVWGRPADVLVMRDGSLLVPTTRPA